MIKNIPSIHASKMPYKTVHALIRYFIHDLTATQTSKLLGIQRKTVNKRYTHLRSVILEQDNMRINTYEPYLLGLTCTHTTIKSTPIAYRDLSSEYLDTLKNSVGHISPQPPGLEQDAYRALIDTQRCIYYKLYNCDSDNRYTLSFWSYCKRRLAKFNGMHPHTSLLHIKESEFRFNCKTNHRDMHKAIYNLLMS